MGEEKTNLYWRQMLWTNNNRIKQKRNKYDFIWKDPNRWSLSFIGGWGDINYVVFIQYAVTPTCGLVWLIIFSLFSSSFLEKRNLLFPSTCRRGRGRRITQEAIYTRFAFIFFDLGFVIFPFWWIFLEKWGKCDGYICLVTALA